MPNPEVFSWFPEKGKVQLVRNVGKEEIGKEEKVSKENLVLSIGVVAQLARVLST